jgi:hypothetical protein
MAMLNIKPTRVDLVKAIKKALKDIPAESEQYARDYKQYKKDMEAWCKSWDYSPANIKEVEPVIDHYDGAKVVRASIYLKKYPANQPKKPKEPRFQNYSLRNAVEELSRALRLLELSDEERVSASLANRVIDYI